ncbi:unnamed protein product [Nezara viridula]|uniref:Uncharacterized protein n=1 Tax=Nezara viridula TaxID=85310 RepID=A0A9P0HMD8_NEZVI|nr:unnamed protein product [Nezara viridula]
MLKTVVSSALTPTYPFPYSFFLSMKLPRNWNLENPYTHSPVLRGKEMEGFSLLHFLNVSYSLTLHNHECLNIMQTPLVGQISDQINKDAVKVHGDNWKEIAQDRQRWRRLIKAAND